MTDEEFTGLCEDFFGSLNEQDLQRLEGILDAEKFAKLVVILDELVE